MGQELIVKINDSILRKVYLEKDLSLYKMASLLKTNTSYLSRAINNKYGKRFSNFLNDCRIQYILELLEEDAKVRCYTIEHIACLSGFSSTSAFYNAFKSYTGKTPANYIKSLHN